MENKKATRNGWRARTRRMDLQLYPWLRVAVMLIAGVLAALWLKDCCWQADVVKWLWLSGFLVAVGGVLLTAWLWGRPLVQSVLIHVAVFMVGGWLASNALATDSGQKGENGYYNNRYYNSGYNNGYNNGHYNNYYASDADVSTDTDADVSTTTTPEPSTGIARLRARALEVRWQLLDRYEELELDDDDYAVLAAMTLGEKQVIGRELRSRYSLSGASHMLALSGLHLTTIYFILSLLRGALSRRVVGCVALLTAIWAYVFVVGLPISAVRAATMLSIYSVGRVGISRASVPLNTLGLAAVIVVATSPMAVLDIGFQMSFMAVVAVLIIGRPLCELLPYRWLWLMLKHKSNDGRLAWLLSGGIQLVEAIGRYVWGVLAVSLAAKLGTLPLSICWFGTLPCYSLLTDLPVIIVATAVLALTVLLFLTAGIGWLVALITAHGQWATWLMDGAIWLQSLVGHVLAIAVHWQNALVAWVASLPGAAITGIQLSGMQAFLLYVAMALIVSMFLLLALPKQQDNYAVFEQARPQGEDYFEQAKKQGEGYSEQAKKQGEDYFEQAKQQNEDRAETDPVFT